jgi:DNA-binding LacI/PurR family transcriptional regulator
VVAVVHYASVAWQGDSRLTGLAASYFAGIQDVCRGQNVNWALVPHYREGDEANVGYRLLECAELAFDGLIVITPPSRDCVLIKQSHDDGVPIVVISRHWPELPVSTVGQDHPQQARLAMEHLVELGHRQIAFVGLESERSYEWFGIRLQYYEQRMASLGTYNPELVAVATDVAEATQALFAQHPEVTAVFAVHDSCAIQVMHCLDEIGLAVPEEVSVIGVGDTGPAPESLPALTTVGFPSRKVGQLAARVLLEHMEDRELAYSRVFVESWVVQRESCAIPRAREPPVWR